MSTPAPSGPAPVHRPSPALAGVVLAAGAGTRLRPLTEHRPKVLLEVGGRALLDRALDDVSPHVVATAVNAHHHRQLVVAHLDRHWPQVHISIEEPEALGTAGAIGRLRGWIAGRDVLIANGDAYRTGGLAHLVDGWDRSRPRLLVVRDERRGDFGPWRFAGASLLPWSDASRLDAVPSGLYEVCWSQAEADGRLELVEHHHAFADCGTPSDYLLACFLAATSAVDST